MATPPPAPAPFEAPTRHASLVVNRLGGNLPFRAGAGPNGGEFFLPWRMLHERFARAGIQLDTRDLNRGREVEFELHLNAQRRVPHPRSYAYLYEDPIVRPLNARPAALARYRRVFTSNEDLIDPPHALRLDYPNDLTPREVPGFAERDLFCVMIASNKALLHPDPRNLHQRRVEAIRHFEQSAPERFALYGHGWNIPAVRPGVLGRLLKRWHEWRHARGRAGPAPFPSYRGPVRHKSEVLQRARFAICYENSRGSPGYLTEKIFDCFKDGCVPVYIGAAHASAPIPADCFIDGDAFASPVEMEQFLDRVDAARFENYQAAMRGFLASAPARRYTNEHWCDTLVCSILSDLPPA